MLWLLGVRLALLLYCCTLSFPQETQSVSLMELSALYFCPFPVLSVSDHWPQIFPFPRCPLTDSTWILPGALWQLTCGEASLHLFCYRNKQKTHQVLTWRNFPWFLFFFSICVSAAQECLPGHTLTSEVYKKISVLSGGKENLLRENNNLYTFRFSSNSPHSISTWPGKSKTSQLLL